MELFSQSDADALFSREAARQNQQDRRARQNGPGTQAAVSSWKVTCVPLQGAAASAFGTSARVSTAPPPSRPMAWGPQENSVSSESRQTVW